MWSGDPCWLRTVVITRGSWRRDWGTSSTRCWWRRGSADAWGPELALPFRSQPEVGDNCTQQMPVDEAHGWHSGGRSNCPSCDCEPETCIRCRPQLHQAELFRCCRFLPPPPATGRVDGISADLGRGCLRSGASVCRRAGVCPPAEREPHGAPASTSTVLLHQTRPMLDGRAAASLRVASVVSGPNNLTRQPVPGLHDGARWLLLDQVYLPHGVAGRALLPAR